MLPLFSATSSRSWGIGELSDLRPFSTWLASAGFDRLMILPIGVVAPGDTSPYSAQSAMAIDPMYIALEDVPDFEGAGGVGALSEAARGDLDVARAAGRVDYARVRRVKSEALAIAFDRFHREEWRLSSPRAVGFRGFMSEEAWWLDDWALYAAIAHAIGTPDWRAWPESIRERREDAMADARRTLEREVLRHQYAQWQASRQWLRAREAARAAGVTVFGDMPFMVSAESPDVWARTDEFMFDVSLGVPPDEFSATGQDWGMPTYRWDRIARTGYAWMRQRVRRMADLYDGYRVDHLVGLFRTYGKPPAGDPFFSPSAEADQIAQGEAILRILIDSRATIIAEDLGVVPPFVRASLARLGVPGCKVLRWERDWDAPGQPFIDPARYPPLSAAMTGTHDTDDAGRLVAWRERGRTAGRDRDTGDSARPGSAMPRCRGPTRCATRSCRRPTGPAPDELFVPAQDVFGWTDRINVPATVGDRNWTWRLPWRVDQLTHVPAATERARFCRREAEQARRGSRLSDPSDPSSPITTSRRI